MTYGLDVPISKKCFRVAKNRNERTDILWQKKTLVKLL